MSGNADKVILDSAEEAADLFQGAFDRSDIIKISKEDPNFLAGMAMPEVFEYSWPPIFIAIWSFLTITAQKSRDFSKLAIGIPRGFGKTTVIKLFILFCILFTRKQFIVVISSNSGHAENIISDVADMLSEPNIRATFGDWKAGVITDTQKKKVFSFRGRNIILAAVGSGGSIRGLNVKNERPDVMIFEDVQTREEADSKLVSDNLFKWMLGTAMKAKSPKGCLTLFIANMYPTEHSILKKLKHNKYWTKFIVGGILEDGTSLWEELQPIAQLIEEYQNELESGHPEIFFSEVLNDEDASVNNLVDLAALPKLELPDNEIALGKFVIIDPATDKTNADSVAIGYFEMHSINGLVRPVLMDLVNESLSPGDTIRKTIGLCSKWGCYFVVIEANAYQYTLKYWSELICAQLGIQGIQFIDIYSGKSSKISRILNMFKAYKAGEIYVAPDCVTQVHHQIRGYNPLKANNVDDVLDLMTYAPKVIETYGALLSTLTIEGDQLMSAELADAEKYSELTNSCF